MSPRSGDRRGEHDRRELRRDLDDRVYERTRWQLARRRRELERRGFDPAPVDPDAEDWVAPDENTDGLRRLRPPAPIGEALDGFIERHGWSERLRGARIYHHWPTIVGDQLVTRCEPVRVAGGILVIRAENQAWATQLRYLTSVVIARAQDELGPGVVHDIRIVVGPLTGQGEDQP